MSCKCKEIPTVIELATAVQDMTTAAEFFLEVDDELAGMIQDILRLYLAALLEKL